ncbi:MAG TPA: hypothetical protein VFN52_03950 [Acidiferrobacteraceae bacterium]|nr:hypothetical protein [Acidiferrobacteraceae bacterium]
MGENQGEGNRDAAKRYDDAQKEFVESGKVEQARSQTNVTDEERRALERAEEIGKSRAKK